MEANAAVAQPSEVDSEEESMEVLKVEDLLGRYLHKGHFSLKEKVVVELDSNLVYSKDLDKIQFRLFRFLQEVDNQKGFVLKNGEKRRILLSKSNGSIFVVAIIGKEHAYLAYRQVVVYNDNGLKSILRHRLTNGLSGSPKNVSIVSVSRKDKQSEVIISVTTSDKKEKYFKVQL